MAVIAVGTVLCIALIWRRKCRQRKTSPGGDGDDQQYCNVSLHTAAAAAAAATNGFEIKVNVAYEICSFSSHIQPNKSSSAQPEDAYGSNVYEIVTPH